MGVITTPDRFNPIKAYCNVRLQQGVPLVDADVNELDDIRKFEMRTFLKWFVGNGIPDGNDGFRIVPYTPPTPPGNTITAASDFQITVGSQWPAGSTEPSITVPSPALDQFAASNYGRCIVDGLDVMIRAPINYQGQALYTGQAGALALATKYGVAVVPAMPATAGPVLVYLDVWERTVFATEDSDLVVPPLGTESCARLKREWVVRTIAGPLPATAAINGAYHVYYALATINVRVAGSPLPVLASDITDLREQRLLTPPSTLIYDVIGSQAGPSASATALAYRQGQNRPGMPLRDAINALLRGDLPGTGEQVIPSIAGTHSDFISYAFPFDTAGGTLAIWSAGPGASANQVLGARLDPANPGAGFTGLTQITQVATPRVSPHAVVLPTGDILVVYNSTVVGSESVLFKRAANLAALAGAAEQSPVASATGTSARHPYAVVVPTAATGGGYVVFFWHSTLPSASWMFRRRQYDATWTEAAATWVAADGTGVMLASTAAEAAPLTTVGDFHAAVDGSGNVYTAYKTGASPSTIQPVRLTVATGALVVGAVLNPSASTANGFPFVVIDRSNNAWVFFASNTGIFCQRYDTTATPSGGTTLVPGTTAGGSWPTAALDSSGLWLFWSATGTLSARFNPSTNTWGAVRQITGGTDVSPFATLGPTGALWLYWRRLDAFSNGSLFFRQIVPQI